MKKVVITGANGFIGKRLVEYFLEKEYEVFCLVHSEGYEQSKYSKVIKFDMNNMSNLEDELPNEVDIFYHLAWNGVNSVFKDDYYIQSKNIDYSLNILKIAQKVNSKQIIFMGSVSEYAYYNGAVDGNNAPSPSDMYSACKIATHYICDIYAKKNNLNFIWVLPSSVYGPGRNDSNLITYSVKKFLDNEKPLFTKLEQEWDYIYIYDLINGLYLIGVKGIPGNSYVIGSGVKHKLSHYIKIIRDSINSKLEIGVGELPYKTDKIDNSITDISLIHKHTGFTPMYSFEEGIKETIEYYKKELY